jgi:hypothetical protein
MYTRREGILLKFRNDAFPRQSSKADIDCWLWKARNRVREYREAGIPDAAINAAIVHAAEGELLEFIRCHFLEYARERNWDVKPEKLLNEISEVFRHW